VPIYPYDNSSRNNVGSNPDFPNISTGRILYMDNYQSEEVMKMLSEYGDYATYMVGTTKKKYRILVLVTWRFTSSTFDAVGVVVDFEVYFCVSSFGQ